MYTKSHPGWAIVLVVLLLLPGRMALAQDAPAAGRTIDLREALQIALEQNLNLRQSANDVALSEAAVAQQRAAFLPNLNLSAGPSLRFGRMFDQTTARLTDQRSEGLSLGASSNVNLFNGFADVAGLEESRLNREASLNSFARNRQNVLYQTTSPYLQLFPTAELIRVEEENLAAQRLQLESIEAAYEAGNRPIADVLQQRTAIAQAEQRLITTQRDYELARLQLMQTLHLTPFGEVTFEEPPASLFAASNVEYDEEDLIRRALNEREDVAAQRLRIEAAGQGVRVARSGYLPSISLNATTGTNYSSLNEQFGFSDQLSSVNPNGSVGVSVSIPVFDRRQTKAAIERAQVSLSNEQLALEMLEQEVAFSVRQSLLDHRTAQAQLAVAERQLESAEESLRAAEARYSVGASTLLEVTEARSSFVEAATSRLQALYNVIDTEMAIAFNAGRLDEVLTSRLQ